jgi:hypothetical protein
VISILCAALAGKVSFVGSPIAGIFARTRVLSNVANATRLRSGRASIMVAGGACTFGGLGASFIINVAKVIDLYSMLERRKNSFMSNLFIRRLSYHIISIRLSGSLSSRMSARSSHQQTPSHPPAHQIDISTPPFALRTSRFLKLCSHTTVTS